MRQVLETGGSRQKARPQWLWRSRAVKLVGGTKVSMTDSPENQAFYSQLSTQASGAGFALPRLVMMICLATGAALDMAVGPRRGKGTGELALVHSLLEGFCPGNVMLADALHYSYFLIAGLFGAGMDVWFDQNGARITDFRCGQSVARFTHSAGTSNSTCAGLRLPQAWKC